MVAGSGIGVQVQTETLSEVQMPTSRTGEPRFQESIDGFVQVLAKELAEDASFVQQTDELGEVLSWEITPIKPTASPLWITGTSWNDVNVSFGRCSGVFEIWSVAGKTDQERSDMLKAICRSVIEGRLTEYRQNENSCYYELILPDGEKLTGCAGWGCVRWLFRGRWRTVEHFEPYTRSGSSSGPPHDAAGG